MGEHTTKGRNEEEEEEEGIERRSIRQAALFLAFSSDGVILCFLSFFFAQLGLDDDTSPPPQGCTGVVNRAHNIRLCSPFLLSCIFLGANLRVHT
jgi:hypothetical protein